jgi:chromosome segregation ATPase
VPIACDLALINLNLQVAMSAALENRDELEKTLQQTQQELDAAIISVENVHNASAEAVALREEAEARAEAAEAAMEAAQVEAAAATEHVASLEGQMEALQVRCHGAS